MGKLSQEKGAKFENRIARWLNQLLPSPDFKRILEERRNGNVGDVKDTRKVFSLIGQGKHMKRPSPLRALDQAREAAITSDVAPFFGVAFIREDRGTNAVVMDPHFFAILIRIVDDYAYECNMTPDDIILRTAEDLEEEKKKVRW